MVLYDTEFGLYNFSLFADHHGTLDQHLFVGMSRTEGHPVRKSRQEDSDPSEPEPPVVRASIFGTLRRRWYLWFGALIVVGVLLALDVSGVFIPTVKVDTVQVADALGYFAGKANLSAPLSVRAGSVISVAVAVYNSNPANNPEGNNTCLQSVSVHPSTFRVSGFSPPINDCIAPESWITMYFSIQTPTSGFDGGLTITVGDFAYAQPS